MSLDFTHKYCESLWEWWRVPTKREFMSIITDIKPSGMDYYTALLSISSENYWSSITNIYSNKNAWGVNLNYGRLLGFYKDSETRDTICIHD